MATAAAKTDDNVVVMPDRRERNLWQRISAVQGEANNIPKKGTAPQEMGGFAFVRDVDVSDAARELFARNGIAYAVSVVEDGTEEAGQTRAGKTIYRTRVLVEIRLRNIDNPDEVEVIRWPGFGDDMADKGLSKAGTSAVKAALTKVLLIGGEPLQDIDAVDVTGGEGRAGHRAKTSGWAEGDYCPTCQNLKDETGAEVVIGKFKVAKGGPFTGQLQCSGKVDGQWANHRVPAVIEPLNEPGELDPRDVAIRRFKTLLGMDSEKAKDVLTESGWGGAQKSTEWIAGLSVEEALTVAENLDAAISGAQSEIPL